jgi:hypothetical protein
MGHFETEHFGTGGAGLHALVIGVGEYPHGERLGAPSLTSPPKSAAAIARWLLNDYRLPSVKLHTLDVLIAGEEFTHAGVTSREANYAHISEAIHEWKIRADSHPENQLLLYFCGHGVTAPTGSNVLLFASDFGSNRHTPYDHAFNFDNVHRALRGCAARRQLLMIDACRGYDPTDKPDEFSRGRMLFTGFDASVDCEQTILYAAQEGHAAEADRNEPSLFAKGFLDAVSGSASNEVDGNWVVGSTDLPYVINKSLKSAEPPTGQRVHMGPGSIDFLVHELAQPPLVEIEVDCNPAEQRQQNSLHYWLTPNFDEPIEAPLGIKEPQDEWKLRLQAGFYTFAAMQPKGRRSGVARQPLRPTMNKVTITCQ